MPFLRIARDKRGYEHTYLIHTSAKKGGATRILYWYRTPPGVRVGRVPFDEEVRRALEAQYPAITFDWPKLMETPAPPPDVEHWRERRRVEKAARQARRSVERDDGDEAPEASGTENGEVEPRVAAPANVRHRSAPPAPPSLLSEPAQGLASSVDEERAEAVETPGADIAAVDAIEGEPDGTATRTGRKRRRRGGRRRRRPGQTEGDPSAPVAARGAADEVGGEGGETPADAAEDGDPSSEASE